MLPCICVYNMLGLARHVMLTNQLAFAVCGSVFVCTTCRGSAGACVLQCFVAATAGTGLLHCAVAATAGAGVLLVLILTSI